MRRLFGRLAIASLVLAAPAPGWAQSADILLNCTLCHDGAEGSIYPDLAGQPARYLERQLHAFRDGRRIHPQMALTATALGDGAAAMARMYADWPVPALRPPASGHATARALFEEGDWTRGLAPCAMCHSEDVQEVGRLAPRLEGQPRSYLEYQLLAYAEGTRRSDSMGRMRAISERLTAEEIADLAAYLAAFSADPETGAADGPGETRP